LLTSVSVVPQVTKLIDGTLKLVFQFVFEAKGLTGKFCT
jgi:hypothetical protein